MRCSVCKEEGHNKRTCKKNTTEVKINKKETIKNVDNTTMVLQTEDTGKMFEMAICLAYGIEYDGIYKYSIAEAEKLKERLYKLKELFPSCSHTAKQGARYDFTSINNKNLHLSAKTTKKGVGMVAPQVIGQPNPKKFCDIINIEYTNDIELKKYMQTNIKNILPILVEYTFDCPNIFYNKQQNSIRFITLNNPIVWDKYQFVWTCNWEKWKNSSSLKIHIDDKKLSLLEFQFHSKNRHNIVIRWFYENFLTVFKDNLTIVNM